MDLLTKIKEKARNAHQTIVLPEGEEERTLKATDILLSEKIARIVLIGNEEIIAKKAKELKLNNIDKAEIVNFEKCQKIEEYF